MRPHELPAAAPPELPDASDVIRPGRRDAPPRRKASGAKATPSAPRLPSDVRPPYPRPTPSHAPPRVSPPPPLITPALPLRPTPSEIINLLLPYPLRPLCLISP
jgi:hypothetical protein